MYINLTRTPERSDRGWKATEATRGGRSQISRCRKEVRAGLEPTWARWGQQQPGAAPAPLPHPVSWAAVVRGSVCTFSPFLCFVFVCPWLIFFLEAPCTRDAPVPQLPTSTMLGESRRGAPAIIGPSSTLQNQPTAHPNLSLLKLDIYARVQGSVRYWRSKHPVFQTCWEHRNTEPFPLWLKNMYHLDGFTSAFQLNE